jgi:prophage tail gpP-like protein
MSDDTVRLSVNGRDFSGWTGVTIAMSIDNVADAFSVSAPFDPDAPDIRAAFKPFGYQRVEVFVGSDRILTGFIDAVSPSIDSGSRGISVQGRSLPSHLIDCSVLGELEFSGLALSTIAKVLTAKFGIAVRADNDTNPLEVARAEYGQSIADFLNSLAAPRNLLLNSSYSGELVISWAKLLKDKPVTADLTEGMPPFKSASGHFDGTKRFSIYEVATQFAGEVDLVGTATDAAIKVYRPHSIAAGDTDQDPDITAARLRTSSFASSIGVSASVSGWRRPDGKLWAERQAITLLAPGAMIYTRTKFIIAEAQLKLSASERSTDLRLVLPEMYTGDLPKETPWA